MAACYLSHPYCNVMTPHRWKDKHVVPIPPLLVAPSPEFVAWAAGFFDGEGYVGITLHSGSKIRSHHQLVCAVAQTVVAPLMDLSHHFGGTVRTVKKGPREIERNWAQSYDWRLGGKAAADFLRQLRPHLRVKAAQADVALRFDETIQARWGRARSYLTPATIALRQECRDELLRLNRRGRAT